MRFGHSLAASALHKRSEAARWQAGQNAEIALVEQAGRPSTITIEEFEVW